VCGRAGGGDRARPTARFWTGGGGVARPGKTDRADEVTPMRVTTKLGIDFGTTRIVVAAVDRGNYPILSFETPEGSADWLPPLVALRGAEKWYGWDAWAVQGEPGWTVIRSLKRVLADAGPETYLDVDGARYR